MVEMVQQKYKLIPFGDTTTFIQDIFANYDNEMKTFLGYHTDENNTLEEQANQQYQYLLSKEQDGKHKYFFIIVNIKGSDKAAGIIYIYDFNEKWQRCALGIGLLPQYRHQGLAIAVILNMITELLHQGIIRIELVVECNNFSSLNLCNKLCEQYKNVYYEGLRKNAWGLGADAHVYSFIAENNKELEREENEPRT